MGADCLKTGGLPSREWGLTVQRLGAYRPGLIVFGASCPDTDRLLPNNYIIKTNCMSLLLTSIVTCSIATIPQIVRWWLLKLVNIKATTVLDLDISFVVAAVVI